MIWLNHLETLRKATLTSYEALTSFDRGLIKESSRLIAIAEKLERQFAGIERVNLGEITRDNLESLRRALVGD